jgi:hypothetical protein
MKSRIDAREGIAAGAGRDVLAAPGGGRELWRRPGAVILPHVVRGAGGRGRVHSVLAERCTAVLRLPGARARAPAGEGDV